MDGARRREFLAATGAFAGLVGLAGCYRPDTSDVATPSPDEAGSPNGEDADPEADDAAARDVGHPGRG